MKLPEKPAVKLSDNQARNQLGTL